MRPIATGWRHLPPPSRRASAPVEPGPCNPVDSVELSASPVIPRVTVDSGLVAGAIPGPVGAVLARELDPTSVDSWDQAEHYYERVRSTPGDIEAIAANTPYSPEQVAQIKDHLFLNTHLLDDGRRRFDADPQIANAWSRLQQGTHPAGDLQLLAHEYFEARFEGLFHTDYRTAHEAANRSGRPSGL